MLGLPEVWQHIAISPPATPSCRPRVVVTSMPANIQHRVHRAGPAEDFPARPIHAPARRHRLRIGLVRPIMRPAKQLRERSGNVYLARAVLPTSLEEEDSRVRVFRQ